jgi:ribosomal protein L22
MAVERNKEDKTPSTGKPADESRKDQREPGSGEKRKATGSKPKRATRSPARAKAKAGGAKGETKARGKARAEPTEAKAKETGESKPATREKRSGARRASPKPTERQRPAPARPVVFAQAKYVRSSARKARLVIEHIRGRSIEDARAVLRHTPRGVARDLERLLNSAVANAENNHELVGDDLVIKEAYADEGPTIKRFRPRALGRATRIRKRTSHLTVTLTPRD